MSTLDHYRREISREEINELPLRRYSGPVQVVRSKPDLRAMLAQLEGEEVLGFDTETRPSFTKNSSHPPALVQLAGAECVYIVQLRRVPLADGLISLLSDPDTVKAGVAVKDDLRELARLRPFEPAGFVDLGDRARQAGLKTNGLRNLAANLLGFRISKGAQCSDWGAPQLSSRQVVYAATDAWVSREIYLQMRQLRLLTASRG